MALELAWERVRAISQAKWYLLPNFEIQTSCGVCIFPNEFSFLSRIFTLRLAHYILEETICLFSSGKVPPQVNTEIFRVTCIRVIIVKVKLWEILHSIIVPKVWLLVVEELSPGREWSVFIVDWASVLEYELFSVPQIVRDWHYFKWHFKLPKLIRQAIILPSVEITVILSWKPPSRAHEIKGEHDYSCSEEDEGHKQYSVDSCSTWTTLQFERIFLLELFHLFTIEI